MKVGLVVMDEDPADALKVARAADRAGVHSLWTIDYYNRSSLTRAAAMAAVTERALVGTSVTPMFARSGLALAAAALDIQALSGGRFVLGLGSSTRRMNSDWYGAQLEHPAPQAQDRVTLVRRLLEHRAGPFSYEGRFDTITLSHLDRQCDPDPMPILVAGVGDMMVRVAARTADGFVGHPIASVRYLADQARPRLHRELEAVGRAPAELLMTSQVIASVDADPAVARRRAGAQVGFYSTVKGYDALFPDGAAADVRADARAAFAANDVAGVTAAGDAIVDDHAVFGTVDDVVAQLERYAEVLDWVQLYPPHYGLSPREIYENELQLIEVARCWTR